MSHKRAKAIRKALSPPNTRAEFGMSPGAFIRALTTYERKVHKRVMVQWPLQVLFGMIPIDYYTQTMQKDCPRALVKKFKRMHKDA